MNFMLKTIISRIERVSDLSGEEISKIEGAFNAVGVRIRKSETEFHDFGTILSQLNEVWGDLDGVTKSYLGELAAGVRQKSTFLAIMNSYSDAVEIASEAEKNHGFALEQNEKFYNSLDGRINLFKNTLEELSKETLDKDFLKGVVDTGTEFFKVLLDIEKNFGLLNVALGITVPLFIALKGNMIAMQSTNIIEFFRTMMIINKQLTTVVGSEIIAFSTLQVVMGGIALGITAIVGGVALYNKHQREFNEHIAESNTSLKDLAIRYDELNDKQKENLTLQAQQALADTEGVYDKAVENIQYLTENTEHHKNKLEELTEAQRNGVELTQQQINEMKIHSNFISKNARKMVESKNIVETHDNAIKILNGDFSSFTDTLDNNTDSVQNQINKIRILKGEMEADSKSVAVLEEAMKALSGQNEMSAKTMRQLLELFPELSEQLSITEESVEKYVDEYRNLSDEQLAIQRELTNKIIDLTEKRIEAYKVELGNIIKLMKEQEKLDLTPGSEKRLVQLEKNYQRVQGYMDGQINRLKDLKSQTKAISKIEEDRDKKTEKPKKIDHEAKFFDQLEKVEAKQQEIARITEKLNQTEGVDKIPLLKEQNKLYKDQQDNLKELSDARKNYIETQDLTLEDEEKLRDKIDEEELSFMKLTTSIYNNNKAMQDLNDQGIQDTITGLEEMKDKAEKLADTYKDDLSDAIDKTTQSLTNQRDKAIEAIDTDIKALEDKINKIKEENKAQEEANKLAEKQLELAKLREKRENILGQKDTRIITGSGIDYVANPQNLKANAEEITKVEKELTDIRLQQREDEKIQKLEKEKAELEESKRNVKKKYDERIADLKRFNKEQQNQVKQNGRIEESLLKGIHKALRLENKSYFDETIQGYKDMVTNINSELSRIRDVSDEIDDVKSSKSKSSRSSKSSSSDKVRVKFSGGRTGSVSKKFYESNKKHLQKLETGGVVSGTGIVQVDGKKNDEEVMLNSKHINRVGSALGFSGSNTQMANKLFSFANSIPSINPVSNTSSSDSSTHYNIDKVIIKEASNLADLTRELNHVAGINN